MEIAGNGARRARLQTAAFVVALAALCAFAIVFRFLVLKTGFTNDHFLHLAGAQQVLFGEWPTRDFLDPGMPLMYVTSALAQLLMGRTLLSEAILVVVAFALAAVLTALTVRDLTASRVAAVLAAAAQVAFMTREYAYPKVLTYALGFWLVQRYVTQPTTRRQVVLAAAVVIAFLFRHDHGIYLGVAGLLASALMPAPDIAARARRAGLFFAAAAVLAVPYAIYVQVFGGAWAYLQKGLEFRDSEFVRQPHEWPSLFGSEPYHALLVYTFWALPVLAAVTAAFVRRGEDRWTTLARILPIAAVALLVNVTALRSPLATRLPDAIVPPLVLGAWLAIVAWRSRPQWLWRAVVAVLLVVAARSIGEVGRTADHLERAGMLVGWNRLPEFMGEVADTLRAPHAEKALPSRAAVALAPFYPYVRRCTAPDHRLLVVGRIPEAAVFSQRPFAGGQSVLVFLYRSDSYQRSVLRRLREQVVPFVLIPGTDFTDDFDTAYPLVAQWVRLTYEPLVTFGDAEQGVQVLVDRSLVGRPPDPETGWPCLT